MTYANYLCGGVRLMTMFKLFERLRFIREAVRPAAGGVLRRSRSRAGRTARGAGAEFRT